MNWIKENKFLTGLLAVLIVGIGVLGYLYMGAGGRLAEATEQYESTASERKRLLNLKPYPSPENVKEIMGQKEAATAKITELHTALAKAELPVEPMTSVQFQDKLRAAVTEVTTLAGTTGTKLPDKFFLGFERYETTTPDAAAAPLLGRQLKAIQWIVTRFVENKVVEIKALNREPLAEEGGKPREQTPAPAPSSKDRGGKSDKVQPAGPPLVQAHPIEIVVFGEQAAMRTVLNDIVGSKEQFYIPRLIAFKNEKEKPPSKGEQAAAVAAAAAPADGTTPAPDAAAAPAAAAPTSAPATTYIVGLEKVEMTLKLEMIDFSDPAPTTAAK